MIFYLLGYCQVLLEKPFCWKQTFVNVFLATYDVASLVLRNTVLHLNVCGKIIIIEVYLLKYYFESPSYINEAIIDKES